MPESRTPWIAIDVDIRKDDRIADLPSDAARWGFVAGVLAEARLQSPRGVFGSKATFEEAVGRFARYLPQYLEVGLLERGSELCDGCRSRYGEVKSSAIVVHNWHRKQADPTHADRQRRYREGRNGDGRSDGERDADSDGNVTAHSRARAVTQTPNTRQETLEELPSVVPRGTPRARPSNGESSAAPSEELIDLDRPDVQALKARGWTHISEQQLERLDEVADYERASEYDVRSGQEVVASWIRSAPRGARLLDHVFATSRRLRDQRLGEADERIERHEQTKGARLHPSLGGAT